MLSSYSPIDGALLGQVPVATLADYQAAVTRAQQTFERWRMVPAPQRGQMIREIGEELRRRKTELGALVTLEAGKIKAEAEGEVQEMIDIVDFAVGLSRQLYGLSMHSERPGHRMYEQWHPLGVIGVITAFNFPVAVWAWNAILAAVCGDCVIWKPAPQTPLCAQAVQEICDQVMTRYGFPHVFQTLQGGAEIGERMSDDPRLPLISATGSTRMGKVVAQRVGARLGRTLLELGGNNGLIVLPDADLDLTLRAVVFGAAGTAGQRCTTLRRLFLHRSIVPAFTARLIAAYGQLRIGDPREASTLIGPLISRDAVDNMQRGLAAIRQQGGEIIHGGEALQGCYVQPCLVKAPPDLPVMQEEIFAPILYLVEFDELDQAISWHNAVPQGLSSAIFTRDLLAAETFLSARGSDCGIANVNIGTSGAEIGGAFGGEKETGGGRESGSDSWKAYMRRQTVTVNWSKELPLAQGIQFDI
ncbi:MAG: aldehyde dehydrogenase family protein [Acidobacteria bacterium]|nr:aldehyde dehydrogenase family protein [Acidobacteriota bacterium]